MYKGQSYGNEGIIITIVTIIKDYALGKILDPISMTKKAVKRSLYEENKYHKVQLQPSHSRSRLSSSS